MIKFFVTLHVGQSKVQGTRVTIINFEFSFDII